MAEALGGYKPPEVILGEADIAKRTKDYNRVLRRLSPEQQGFVTELTSVFNELDVYQLYRGNLAKVEDLSMSLGLIGLKKNERRIVLKFLNLS